MATQVKQRTVAKDEKSTTNTPAGDEYTPCIVTMNTDPYRKQSNERRKYEEAHPETVDWEKRLAFRGHNEFGGAIGVTTILVFSHILIWFFTICLKVNQGLIIMPESVGQFFNGQYHLNIVNLVLEHATPQWYHVTGYFFFLFIQAIFAVTLPGIKRLGEPLPELKGKKLPYLCNAVAAFWTTFATFAVLHYLGLFPYTLIIDNIAPFATCAMLTADFISIAVYYNWFNTGQIEKNISHNFFYDLFMGRVLNPRITLLGGELDIKMFFETRVSWIMMTMITTSAALKFYEQHGYLSNNMIIISMGISIYSYSIMKGEHLILPTWDITTEYYGGMLCFWNSALPFLYSAQSVFILRRDPSEIAIPDPVFYVMMTILLVAYYCFDTVNSQKNTFRQQYNQTWEPRPWALPQFAYGTIEDPKYLRTKAGTPLLLSGWYAWARKWQYTCDATMGMMWSLSCGFNLFFIPKFYITFFISMLIHRGNRDQEKCARKYGADWKKYCELVPYQYIPYVY